MRRLTLALLALAAASPALAQDEPPAAAPSASAPAADAPHRGGGDWQAQRGRLREVCGADLDKFCADAGQDRRARHECMLANQAKFSKPCQDALSEMEARRAARQSQRDPHDPQ